MTVVPGNQCAKSLPSVAVIIPCYNAEKWVAQAIQSALDQDYPNLEVIVIDDGSTDGSLDVIKSFGDRIRWETGPNRGACAARNRGLALTEAEYIKFLDADDWLIANAIASQAEHAGKLRRAAKEIVFGNALRVNEHGQLLPNDPNPWLKSGEAASRVWMLLGGPRTSAPLHRRDYLLDVQGFRENLPAGQEYDMHRRLLENNIQFVYYDCPVYYYREHNDPNRISNKVAESHLYWSDILSICEDLRRSGYTLNSIERAMIATYAWSRAHCLAEHKLPGAAGLLRLAHEIAPGDLTLGGRFYRIARPICGPLGALVLDIKKTNIIKEWRGHCQKFS